MEFIKFENHHYQKIVYKDFIAKNLSENGIVIFSPNIINSSVLSFIKEKSPHNFYVQHLPLLVFDEEKQRLETFNAFINLGGVSPIGFFDFFRGVIGRFGIESFFASDFHADKIYLFQANSFLPFGSLNDFAKIFSLSSKRYFALRYIKFAVAKGYFYFNKAHAFRNEVDRDFCTYKDIMGEENFEVFNSFEECKSHLNKQKTILCFEKDAILNFDIMNPALSIRAKTISARNLTIKNLVAENQDVFCGKLVCKKIRAANILAEQIECEKIDALMVKTSYSGGLKIKAF